VADGVLGKVYGDKEIICRQGDRGDCMFVVQKGKAQVVREDGSEELLLGELGPGDIFGEMAIFDRQRRSATVRAQGDMRVLTLDKRAFMRRVHEDPTLALRILEKLSLRIRSLDEELVLRSSPRAGATAGNSSDGVGPQNPVRT
jgi:CRP/FNR family transcriptional regulator